MGECYFCWDACSPADFCEGCDSYICDYCNVNEVYGRHEPEDHNGLREEYTY